MGGRQPLRGHQSLRFARAGAGGVGGDWQGGFFRDQHSIRVKEYQAAEAAEAGEGWLGPRRPQKSKVHTVARLPGASPGAQLALLRQPEGLL